MYVANHGTDDPTQATLPFLVATGAGSAEIDCCIALLGEAANLAKPGMIVPCPASASHRSGNSWRRSGTSRYRCMSEARARSPVG